MKILSIGEILWDVIQGEQHLGGAPFNFAVHASRLSHESYLLSAVGDDERGRLARNIAESLGVKTRYLATSMQAETGIASVTTSSNGENAFRIARPAAYDFIATDDDLLADSFDAIYYGTLIQTFEPARRATMRVLNTFPKAIRFYDVNLRPPHFDLECVKELMSRATVVKLNEGEAAVITGSEKPHLREFCETQTHIFGLHAIAVTRAEQGCAVFVDGEYVEAPAFHVNVADTVGAGDAFAAGFLHGIAHGWPAAEVAEFANRVGALVASREGGVPAWTPEEIQQLQA